MRWETWRDRLGELKVCAGDRRGEEGGEEMREGADARWVWLIYTVRERHLVPTERMGDSRV